MYKTFGKPMLDWILAVLAMVVFSPLFGLLAVLIYCTMGTPVLFAQRRPGRHGKLFTTYKFRTMTDARDPQGNLLPDEARLTSLGHSLRSTSLDELPAFLSVVKGEISLVGPRPLLMEYMDQYTAEQNRRHEVKPGMTGWAQVNGRNALSWDQKFALDVWYVEHQSIWLDLYILVLTPWIILRREGVNQPGYATAKKFQGGDPSSCAF